MQISFTCGNCGTQLAIDAAASGSAAVCPQCQAALTVPALPIGAGTVIGGFQVERLLGRGSMGMVYLARQLSLNRPVALKILPDHLRQDPQQVQRFLQEMQVLARLDHPNIVAAHEAGEDQGKLYLAMGYVEGQTLEERIKQGGPIAWKEACGLVKKLANALAYAWDKHQLLHRDIKPANVLLDSRGEPKLADMGLVKSVVPGLPGGGQPDGLTVYGTVMGTPNYMSPEQAAGCEAIDCGADMYALGALFYHMLTGQIPFQGSTAVDTLRKQLTAYLPDPRKVAPNIPERVVVMLEIMLAKDRAERHQDWTELLRDLQEVLAGRMPKHHCPAIGKSMLMREKPAPARSGVPIKARPQTDVSWLVAKLVGAGLLVVGIVLAVKLASSASKSRRTGYGVAPVSTSIPPPPPLPPSDRTAELKLALEAILDYEDEQAEDYAELLRRLTALANAARGTRLEFQIDRELQRIRTGQAAAVARALAELKAEVEKLAAAGKFQAAERAARDYSGAFAAETAAARAELANWVKDKAAEQAQLDAQQAQLKEARAAEARKRLTYLFDSVALLILQQDLAGAKELLLRSAREEQYAAVSNELAAAEIFIRELGGSRDRILKSFERQKGQTVRFQLRGGALETGTVLEVADGRVLLQQNVTGGTITREVKPDELSLAEKQQRVGGVETPETLAIKGLLALREKDPNGAAALFAKAGALEKEGKGAGLAAALARMTNALEAEQRETAARNALREILQLAGLADLPLEEITAETVKEREYPAGEVAKIRAALEAFNSRHGETKTAKTQAALLEALAAVKIQPAGQMSVDLGDGVKLELVWIQPGEFLMGSPANEADRKEDEEQHKVKITKGFWMGKYEVTQAQWEQVMGNNPTAREHVGKDRPVNWVSWSDCHQFLRKLNELVQNKKIKIKQGEFRLPTEAEWEYACRAGTKTRFCSGDKEDDLDAMGWCKENSGATTHAVGQKKANAWGLFDMHGNLGEWCEDYYANYPGGEVKDPTGPATSEAGLVFRGGNWLENHHTCRSAKRDFGAHKSCRVTIGLRVVLR